VNAILPEIRVPFHRPSIGSQERTLVNDVLDSGWLTTGKMVPRFENEFAEEVGVRHALAVNSATNAALLILHALGVGSGDDVVVPTWTFSGPAMMARMTGARVVLCDVDPATANMTPETLARAITYRTKVVMPTHFGGRPCDVAGLAMIADKYGAIIVDDAAHAFPARYRRNGPMVGGNGVQVAATFFSFYATKTLTCGEGGMVTTYSDSLAEKIRQLRGHGMSREAYDRYTDAKARSWHYDITSAGWKANLGDLNAAVGLGNLKRMTELQEAREVVEAIYRLNLTDVLEIALPPPSAQSSWHLFPIQIMLRAPDAATDVKAEFIKEMLKAGVACSVHFIPLHQHSFWQQHASAVPTPNANRLAGRMVSLPIYPGMSVADVEYVAQAVKHALNVLMVRWGLI
jgi:dTDP-4-amino-4,6-dideoxygalactose transaminase